MTEHSRLAMEDLLLQPEPVPLPEVVDGVDVEAAMEALSMLVCPWRLRIGICVSGCREEPRCETNQSKEGWAHELRQAVSVEESDD